MWVGAGCSTVAVEPRTFDGHEPCRFHLRTAVAGHQWPASFEIICSIIPLTKSTGSRAYLLPRAAFVVSLDHYGAGYTHFSPILHGSPSSPLWRTPASSRPLPSSSNRQCTELKSKESWGLWHGPLGSSSRVHQPGLAGGCMGLVWVYAGTGVFHRGLESRHQVLCGHNNLNLIVLQSLTHRLCPCPRKRPPSILERHKGGISYPFSPPSSHRRQCHRRHATSLAHLSKNSKPPRLENCYRRLEPSSVPRFRPALAIAVVFLCSCPSDGKGSCLEQEMVSTP